ncbi:MAG: hypothetical protein M3P06_02865 [Acidobacteriota bacterium]|nr:hypothetical protein [Acidobacteriota bacterium]
MEPMDPKTKASILANAAFDATDDDVDEYERLMAERFTIDPNMPQVLPSSDEIAAMGVDAEEGARPITLGEIEAQLTELRTKLFPGEK